MKSAARVESSLQICVLVVDDEEEIRRILVKRFERIGFRVLAASGGYEGIKLLRENPVDLVLSDMRMPMGSGPELVQAIESADLEKSPVVLLMSAFLDVEPRGNRPHGAHAIIPKPTSKNKRSFFYSDRQGVCDAIGALRKLLPRDQLLADLHSRLLKDLQLRAA